MGCYRLTYHYETPTLFLEQGEKNYTPEWHVTVNAGSKLGDAGAKVLTQSGTFDIDKAIAWLNKNAASNWNTVPTRTVTYTDPVTGKPATKEVPWFRCATWISNALNAGFDDGIDHTASTRAFYAKDDGPMLEAIGYQAVIGDVSTFEKGDVIIFQPSNASAAGHIEMWTGTQFISDWKQGSNFYPNTNTCPYPSFTVYRLGGN